ncbi:MAG TPA: pilus assembly PilX N-terminal domain-containing protein [Thermoanaerobaculia bacterium]|nr:pilus assembly PilX N-terminal domain-containing protein [Thermoanaerobaculia bacterium]
MKKSGFRNRSLRSRDTRRGQRGVALIMTIVVTLILSLIGLSMLSFTETEERTAVTHRDEVQVDAVAEAGVRLVQQMFRNPAGPLVPQYTTGTPGDWEFTTEAHLNAMGVARATRGARGIYTGAGDQLFQGPFSGDWAQVFGGDRDANTYDLRFSCDGIASADCFLDQKLNSLLTNTTNPEWNNNVGRITDIRLFEPPISGSKMWGYATVLVTATKFDAAGNVVATETLEAILGADTSRPAILADGNLEIESSSHFCGNSCETLHANGNIKLYGSGSMSGGDPTVTATGTVDESGTPIIPEAKEGVDRIEPPRINPWDTTYRPTTEAGLEKYYLMTTRTPSAVWTDDDASTSAAGVSCANASTCQDYGLTAAARTAGAAGKLYRWDRHNDNWDLIETQPSGGTLFTQITNLQFFVRSDTADVTDVGGSADDGIEPPFEKSIVPRTFFQLESGTNPTADTDPQQGITLLVDGAFALKKDMGNDYPDSGQPWKVSIIAVGGIWTGGSQYLAPALLNKVLLISGRDLFIESSFNNNTFTFGGTDYCTSGTATTPPPENSDVVKVMSAVFAAHEQLFIKSSGKFLGILVAENGTGSIRINIEHDYDSADYKSPKDSELGDNAMLIDSSARHTYICDEPAWPWSQAGQAKILAIGTSE